MDDGLKTFPFPVKLDDRIALVEAEFGCKGFAVVWKLHQAIHSRGYYMKWDIDTQLLFIRDYCLSEVGRNAVSEIVACCIRRGVFDSLLYEKYEILTSKRIQETFLTAKERSKKVIFEKDYALPIVYEFIANANKKEKNVNIFFKNADICEQKKEKEKKEKEVSKKVTYTSTDEPPLKEDGTYDFEDWERHLSHASIMDKMFVEGQYRKELENFLRYCAGHGHFLMNEQLIDIICRLQDYYGNDDVEKIKSLDRAMSGGYFDIKEGKS